MGKWDGLLRSLARRKRGQLVPCARDDVEALRAAVLRIGREAGAAYCASGGERLSPVPPPSATPVGFTWVYATFDPEDARRE